ncbi:MAG: hypothetical protein WEC17_01560 [Candidatus Saccharimonadales bacterium]
MAQRKAQPVPGQNPLFTTAPNGRGHQSPTIKTWQEIEASPANRLEALVGNNAGPNIEITGRAERLVSAINALAHRRMLKGFDIAVDDSRYKRSIWERYLYGTPKVIQNSQNKTERLMEEAMRDFWQSAGYTALKGSGLLTRGQIRKRISTDFEELTHIVANPDTRQELRNNLRSVLPDDHPYQTVKGWRDAREAPPTPKPSAIARRTKSPGPEDEPAATRHISVTTLPRRSSEIDAAHLKQAREIENRIDRQIEVRREEQIDRENAATERIRRVLEENSK